MFQRGGEARALIRIVAQPVEQFGEAPLAGVDAAAPVDGFQMGGVRGGRDLGGFPPGAVVAPEVVIVDGVEVGVHRNHAGARGIERDGVDGVTIHAGIFEGAPGGGGQRGHVVGVALRGVVRVLLFAQQRVRSRAGAKTALDGVEDGNANAEGAEIYSGDNAHVRDLLESVARPFRLQRRRPCRRSSKNAGTNTVMAAWKATLLVNGDVPAQVVAGGFLHGARHGGHVGGYVMLEAVFADEAQQGLKVRNLHHAGAAEGSQRIVGELALADVAIDAAFQIVGGEAREAHRAGLHQALAGAVSVLAAHRAGDDLLEVHLDTLEEVLRQVAAMEAHGLVGIVAVVIVPVEQGARGFAGQLQGVHADHAADIHFAGARHQVLAHHAHHGAGHHAEEFLERGPALYGADGDFRLRHPGIDHGAELGHLHEGFEGNLIGGDVLLDGGELGFGLAVLHADDAAEDLRQVDRFHADAAGFQQFLAIAHGVESRGTGADGADGQAAQAAHDAADGGEPGEVLGEHIRTGGFGVQRGERVGNAVLLEVIAGAHLAAEAVAAILDGHQSRGVRRGLYEDGHVEVGLTQSIGDGALFAEIRQRDDDTVDVAAMALKQVGAESHIAAAGDGAAVGLFRSHRDYAVARFLKYRDHVFAAALGQVGREESSVAHDHAECNRTGFSVVHLVNPFNIAYQKIMFNMTKTTATTDRK